MKTTNKSQHFNSWDLKPAFPDWLSATPMPLKSRPTYAGPRRCSAQIHAVAEHKCPAAHHKDTRLSRSALPITETELKLIAAAAIIGLSRIPKNG